MNERSIAIRNSPGSYAGLAAMQAASSAALSSVKPSPVAAEVLTIAAPSRNVPRSSPRMSSSTRSSQDRIDQVAFAQGDDAGGKPEQGKNLHVLARLRHDRVVGRDHQHRQVEPRSAGEHVANEPLVAGHVDQGKLILAELERRESQVDRDPALFFSGQAIGVDAGEGAAPRPSCHGRCGRRCPGLGSFDSSVVSCSLSVFRLSVWIVVGSGLRDDFEYAN